MNRLVLITDNEVVVSAIARGTGQAHPMTVYPRVEPLLDAVYPGRQPMDTDWGRCEPGPLRLATHVLVDLGCPDGLAQGPRFLRRIVRDLPELKLYALTNAPVPSVLPADLRGVVRLIGKERGPALIETRWRMALATASGRSHLLLVGQASAIRPTARPSG